MFPITVVNDDVLKSSTDKNKTLVVEMRLFDGTWQNISNYVKEVNIIENLIYDGNSTLNKVAIKVKNTEGEFSPAKAGASSPFNPIVDNKPYLTHKFPIRIKVTTATNTYTIFQGYANKVSENGLDAVIEAYDILFALSRKRLSKGFYAVYITPEEAINNLLNQSGVLTDWQNIFGTAVNIAFSPSPQANIINYLAEGGKSYFEALNGLCQSIGAYFTYSAINNTLYFNFPADANYAEPTANLLIQTDGCAEYEIDNQVDVPNRVSIEAELLEPYGSKINDYWTFKADDISGAIRLPKNTRSNMTISFGNKGYNPDLNNVWLVFRTYIQSVESGQLIYRAGGSVSGWYDLTVLPITINNGSINITINDYEVKIDGIILDVTNNSADINVAIVEAKVDVYPYIESGSIKQIFEEADVIPNEKSLKTSYIEQETLQRLAESYLKYLRSLYIVNAKLMKFMPDLFVGGAITMTLYDTSLNNSTMILRRVQHTIKDGFWLTTISAGLLGSPSLNVASQSDAGVVRTTLAPVQLSVPTSTVIDIEGSS